MQYTQVRRRPILMWQSLLGLLFWFYLLVFDGQVFSRLLSPFSDKHRPGDGRKWASAMHAKISLHWKCSNDTDFSAQSNFRIEVITLFLFTEWYGTLGVISKIVYKSRWFCVSSKTVAIIWVPYYIDTVYLGNHCSAIFALILSLKINFI